MKDSDVQQQLIDRVVEEFTERCRRGERPSVADYVAKYPEAADELGEVLPPVAWIEQIKPQASGGVLPRSGAPLEQLGEYKIVREIGRGGMGIVYEAIQQSLGRRVALKLLPGHALHDPKRLDRFRIEAQAAARLHHTNIVPVFGFFHSDGLHYYVMQFIDGFGLDALVDDLRGSRHSPKSMSSHRVLADTTMFDPDSNAPPAPPLPHAKPAAPRELRPTGVAYGARDYWRLVAEIGVQAGDALEYAHHHGTLHRDIKPANLLLDGQGTVWVTDFGLARLRDQDGLTAAGDMLGTLQYMPPESLRGEFGPAADQYSLGLTLYELLTLSPPYSESNPARLLQLVSNNSPPAPRTLNSHIPRDLETIVLKATAREPSHRYPSLAAMVDDLRRFLADRPIEARRTSALEQLWRWCRRNRALSAAAGVALVSLVAAAVVGWWAAASTSRALREEAKLRVEAEAAEDRATANVELSLKALEDIFAAIAPPDDDELPAGGPPGPPGRRPGPPGGPPQGPGGWMPGGPGGPRGERPMSADESQHHAELLQAVITFYDRFAEQNDDADPKLRFEAAQAARRAGELYDRLGKPSDANEAFQRSAALLAALVKEFPDNREYLVESIRTEVSEATRLSTAGDTAGAEKMLAQSLVGAQRLLKDSSKDRKSLDLLINVYRESAKVAERASNNAAAEKNYQMAIDLAEQQFKIGALAPGLAESFAFDCGALTILLRKEDRSEAAEKVLLRSVAVLEKYPHSPEGYGLLALQYDALAELNAADAAAAEKYRAAAAAARRLAPPPGGPGGPPRP